MMATAGKRILLVDDDESILESVKTALESQGYEVLVARDGSEALVRVERDFPDLVILDVVMPKRSGFIVLDRIRKTAFKAPRIIMVTANDSPRHRDFAESRGIDGFVSKPFEIDELLTQVETVLNV